MGENDSTDWLFDFTSEPNYPEFDDQRFSDPRPTCSMTPRPSQVDFPIPCDLPAYSQRLARARLGSRLIAALPLYIKLIYLEYAVT